MPGREREFTPAQLREMLRKAEAETDAPAGAEGTQEAGEVAEGGEGAPMAATPEGAGSAARSSGPVTLLRRPEPKEPLSIANYAAMGDLGLIKEIIRDNLGPGAGFTELDLTRIRIPAGGTQVWTMPTPEGDVSVPEISGVVVHWTAARAYWPGVFRGGGQPPQCVSRDGLEGIGLPGGDCMTCPMNAWDSKGPDKKGKACKEMRLVFLVRQSDLLPVVIALPPTSLHNVKSYFLSLASMAVPYYGVVTRFGLEKAVAAGGIEYSRAKPTMVGQVSNLHLAQVKSYGDELRKSLGSKVFTLKPEDVAAGEED